MKHCSQKFYRTLGVLTLPIALQNVISYSVNMMDTVMIGQLGQTALSATSLANQIFFFFMLLIYGTGGGAMPLCSQFWGRRDLAGIRQVITIVLKISIGISLIFTLLLLAVPEKLLGLFTPDAEIIAAGTPYLKLTSISYLFFGVNTIFLVVLRCIESVNISLAVYGISFVANCFFNYMFIFGKFGAPALGVTGAAIGTVIARMLESAVLFWYLARRERKIRYRPSMFRQHDRKIFAAVLHSGMPVILNELFWACGFTLQMVVLGHLSAAAVAAASIGNVLYQFMTSLVLGVANASAVVIGKTIGAGKTLQARLLCRKLLKLYLLIGSGCAVVLILAGRPFIGLYEIPDSTAHLAGLMLYIFAGNLFCMAFTNPIITGIMRGSGDTRFAAVVDLFFLWLLLGAGALAAFVFHRGAFAVLLTMKLEAPLKTLSCLLRLRGRAWIHRLYRQEDADRQ